MSLVSNLPAATTERPTHARGVCTIKSGANGAYSATSMLTGSGVTIPALT